MKLFQVAPKKQDKARQIFRKLNVQQSQIQNITSEK